MLRAHQNQVQDVNIHDTDIVSAIHDSLIQTLGTERFGLWFSRVRFAAVPGGLRVEADNRFSLDLVRKNFRLEIERAVASIDPQRTVDYGIQDTAVTPATPPVPTRTISNSASAHSLAADPVAGTTASDVDAGADPTVGADVPAAEPKAPDRRPVGPKMQGSHTSRRRFARLETIQVGTCNELALTSIKMLLQEPGRVTPLLLYGPPGCGKTHLLEGIWSRLRHQYPRQRIVYLTAEQFTCYFLEALQAKSLPSFRRKYREADVLILDDVHFFIGKQATLVEVVHTIDSLTRQGKQIVMASDRPVGQMSELGQEFCARLMGGLSCAIDALDLSVRRQLIRIGAQERGLVISDSVITLLAEQIEGDGRQIRGVLNVLLTHTQSRNVTLDEPAVQTILDELYGDQVRLVQLAEIERIVCEVFGLDRRALQAAGRAKQLAQPRMLAMWLARRHTPAGLTEISKHFGRSSHTTVLSADKRVTEWMAEGAQLRLGNETHRITDVVRKIERRLRAG